MKLKWVTKNIPFTDAMKEYVKDEAIRLDKFEAKKQEAVLTLSVEKTGHALTVTAYVSDKNFQKKVQVLDSNYYKAASKAIRLLEKEWDKERKRYIDSKRVAVSPVEEVSDEDDTEEDEDE